MILNSALQDSLNKAHEKDIAYLVGKSDGPLSVSLNVYLIQAFASPSYSLHPLLG